MLLVEVSDEYRIPVGTLYSFSHRRIGPPAYKVGKRLLYKRHEVEAWIESQAVRRAS